MPTTASAYGLRNVTAGKNIKSIVITYKSKNADEADPNATVNGGTIQHLGGTDMAYAIDNLTNGKGTYAETIINGGAVKSTYRAIRQFLNGVEAENILTVNGGTIEGTNKSIWMQDPSKNSNTGTLTVAADAKLTGDVYLSVTAGSTEWPVEVAVAAAALQGESKVLDNGNVPAGYELANVNGTYGVYNGAAKIGNTYYNSIAEAMTAAQAGDVVTILAGELTQNLDVKKAITVVGQTDAEGNNLVKFNGKLNLWNKLRLMWDLKVKKSCDRIFGMIFAVTPEFQGKGVESGFMKAVLDNYIRTDRNRYKSVEFAWIGDFNPVMNRMVERYICARKHKMHTTYRYLFDRTKEFTRCPKVGFKPRPKVADAANKAPEIHTAQPTE